MTQQMERDLRVTGKVVLKSTSPSALSSTYQPPRGREKDGKWGCGREEKWHFRQLPGDSMTCFNPWLKPHPLNEANVTVCTTD